MGEVLAENVGDAIHLGRRPDEAVPVWHGVPLRRPHRFQDDGRIQSEDGPGTSIVLKSLLRLWGRERYRDIPCGCPEELPEDLHAQCSQPRSAELLKDGYGAIALASVRRVVGIHQDVRINEKRCLVRSA